MNGIIYMASLEDGRAYIGQTTTNLSRRMITHRSSSKKDKTRNTYFHNALKKYGWDAFSWEILSECTSQDELNKVEKHFINLYNTRDKEYGFNIREGGTQGCSTKRSSHTEEHKKKISEALKAYIFTEEHKKKISEAKAGKTSYKVHPRLGKGKPLDELTPAARRVREWRDRKRKN